ncbi:cornifelin homolog B [Esox lucius]|uniref:Uncharacterized protein n=1 Tax=Esox lucius TaxID=8010 RepID=A0A6Q2ZCZ1_ESOLU|nr:cornifelin homolog B [Esox lucius]
MDMDSFPLLPLTLRAQPESMVPKRGEWTTGLCDWWQDMGDCCCALWCLPVFACKTTSAVGACPCLPLLDCISCVPPASLAMRASVRELYSIEGGVLSDCFYGCCCYPLSWLQISRELKSRAAGAANTNSRISSPSFSTHSWNRFTTLSNSQGAHLI